MELILASTVGILFASGFFLLMNSNLFRMVFGYILIYHGLNIFLFSTGGLIRGQIPIITDEKNMPFVLPEALLQALILTAIVIGFASTAFLVALVRQAAVTFQVDDYDEIREAEK